MFTHPQRTSFRRIGRNGLIIVFATLLVLELFTRLVWWNDQVVRFLFGKEVALLPAPLVNERQIESLKAWAADPNKYVQFDPVLGWSIRPNAQGQQDGMTYTSNSAGMRSLREYLLTKTAGILRIGTFGPSFTHSDDVADEATWQAQMERARPDLEVMNWGVGGYGTDQSFLRYQTQGAAYQPDVVLIGFEEDNIRRNVNRFRPFFRGQTDIPLTKPVFIEKGNELTLLENPFQTLEALEDTLLNSPERFLDIVCPHDFYCQRDRYQSQPLDIFASYRFGRTLVYEMTQASRPGVSSFQNPFIQRVNFLLIRLFAEEAVRNGSVPIVVIFPERSSIEAHERGEATPYAAGITLLREQGLQVIDLAPAFTHARQTDQRDYLDYYAYDGGHFSQLGNYVVSQTVLAHLCQQKILENCGDFLKQMPP